MGKRSSCGNKVCEGLLQPSFSLALLLSMTSGLMLVMEAGNKLLASAKVTNPRGCSIETDRHLEKPVLVLKGTVSETSVRLPREDRPLSSLRLQDSLLVAQVCLDALNHFALEVVLSQGGARRTKLLVGTHIKTAKYDESTEDFTLAYLPLIIPHGKWVQVVFHIAGIVQSVFALPPCKCIDSIAIAGTGKMCSLYASSDEQACIDATPESMALFAVPAYAPPIWKSACSAAESPTFLPQLEAVSGASAADAFPQAQSLSCSASPPPSPPPAQEKPLGPPSHLLPPVTSPPTELTQKSSVVSARAESARSSQRCDYIRIIEDEGNPAADEANSGRAQFGGAYPQLGGADGGNRRAFGNGARSVADNAGGALSGWEQLTDDRKPETAATSPGRTGRAELSRRPPGRSLTGSPNGGGTAADNERMQRIIAARKRQVPPRQNSTGTGGLRGRSTSLRRQQRLRRRMRVMRANEQKVNSAAAAKALTASDIPLSQHIELTEDFAASTPVSLSDAPLCGYGFGYLGVLKANGDYEEDEDANLNLRGALTLNSDDE